MSVCTSVGESESERKRKRAKRETEDALERGLVDGLEQPALVELVLLGREEIEES